MRNRAFISQYVTIILIAFLLAGSAGTNVVKSQNRYNVVFIVIDDFRIPPEPSLYLPNIGKMAADGIVFKNTFAQQALCAPSRNSMLTGRRPDSLHLYDFYSYWRTSVGNFTTIPQFFKENGYKTYSVGKVFHPGVSSNYTDDYPLSWTNMPYHPPTEKYKDAAVCKDAVTKKYHKNLICPVKIKCQPEGSLPDLQSLEYAGEVLTRHNNSEPFFLAVGFHKPHIPLKYPQKYLGRVPLSKVHPPKYPHKPTNLPTVAWHPWTDVRRRDDIRRLNISYPFGTMPPDWALRIRQSYYAAELYIDDLIGMLMDDVNRSNTVVVLTSDHGWSLGENGLWAKYSNFDAALRVPLIFNVPGSVPKSIETPVELLDIFPTLVQLSGIKANVPKCQHRDTSALCFDGMNLVPLMESESRSSKRFAISQYPRPSVYPKKNSDKPRLKDIIIMGYSIRTKRYRYTEWISFNNTLFTRNWNTTYGVELYDHVLDPEESNNVYSISIYKTRIQSLSKKLRAHVENY